jgi:hypothetical protein
VHHALDAARASQGDDADLAAVAQALRAAAMSSSDRARAKA